MRDEIVAWKADELGINDAPQDVYIAAYRGTGKLMELARQKAREFAPERLGRLKGKKGGMGQIWFQVESNGEIIEGILLATARDPETGIDYAIFVHEGTGMHGPKKKLITPKKAKVLVWVKLAGLPRPRTPQMWKEYRIRKLLVFARFTKGQKPNPFLAKGLQEASKRAQEIFSAEMDTLNRKVS